MLLVFIIQQQQQLAAAHNQLMFLPTRVAPKPPSHEDFNANFTPQHLANPGLEKGYPGWQGVNSWPGYRVNVCMILLADGLTRVDEPSRVESQPGLV